MKSIAELEADIRELPPEELEELARRIDSIRVERVSNPSVDSWLAKARGAAVEGTTTDRIMSLTRGDR